jgi:hypothetical protein
MSTNAPKETLWSKLGELFAIRRRVLELRQQPARPDLSGVFAVSDQEPWWLAVNQVLDDLERETAQFARDKVADTNKCISAVGAGEGVAMVRLRLKEIRDFALKRRPGEGGS